MYLPVPTYHGIYTRTTVYIPWLKSLKYLRPQVILSIKVCVVSFQKDLYPPIRYLLAADPPAFIFLLGGGGNIVLCTLAAVQSRVLFS